MLAIERKNEILNKLRLEQRVLVSELAVHYGVTEETIRRDLDKLEKEGYATKTYGGAIWGNSTKTDLSHTIRNKTNVDAKTAIATLVSNMIEDGDRIAVGIDIKDGFVAIKGWLENSQYTGLEFCQKMQDLGVKTLIITDISKDGAMKGTNRELYKELSQKLSLNITASGGVSTIDDVKALREMNLYGAIIGKAYYIGAIDLAEAVEVAK